MDCFFITRFSLRIPEYEQKIGLTDAERNEWFKYRSRIFNSATLKCAAAQTTKARRHFLLLDELDRDLYEENIATPDFLVPIFTRRDLWVEDVSARIAQDCNGPALIARLDSDDLIARDYLEMLSACAATPEVTERASREGKVFLKARQGYITDLNFIQRYFHDHPSFLATYYPEFRDPLDLGGNHRFINSRNPVPCDNAEWARFVHGSNVANDFKKRRVFRVTDNTWPAHIPFPDPEVSEITKFPASGTHLKVKNDQRRLKLLSRPGGSVIVKIMAALQRHKR
ncbi:hypothetical protein [Rhodosalinus sediminis]|uniref:hypothetical protein n=1 Tax=Rhodosalinus sediminis TaxID=1940533 RepID=UPI0023562000|nr:hypothetical protein [Rhodosalinus sediminis]